jgi:uncharacterized membrane protein
MISGSIDALLNYGIVINFGLVGVWIMFAFMVVQSYATRLAQQQHHHHLTATTDIKSKAA